MNPYHKIKSEEAFHEARKRGVGASDIATLAGLNKGHKSLYRWVATGIEERMDQSPLTLYREKRGLVIQVQEKKDGKDPIYWGKELEAMLLRRFISGRYGDEAAAEFLAGAIRGRSSGPFKVKTEAMHPERRYCLSHADLLVDEGHTNPVPVAVLGGIGGVIMSQPSTPYLVEAKTSGLYSAKRREGVVFDGYDPDDRSQFGVPDKVFLQVQWQLYTYGLQEAWVVVLIDTSDYREYGPFEFDPRHIDQSLALAERFWGLVESGTEPTPITWGDVVSVYSGLEDKTAMVSGDDELRARAIIAKGRDLKARAKVIEEEIDDVKMALGILAGDTVNEDGTIRRTMNRVLNDSSGEKLATFRDQTKDTLSLPMADVNKKLAKAEANAKKIAEGKMPKPADIEAATLTDADREVLELDKRLRALGCYKTSEAFRVVTY